MQKGALSVCGRERLHLDTWSGADAKEVLQLFHADVEHQVPAVVPEANLHLRGHMLLLLMVVGEVAAVAVVHTAVPGHLWKSRNQKSGKL